jgi:hypothetical protein
MAFAEFYGIYRQVADYLATTNQSVMTTMSRSLFPRDRKSALQKRNLPSAENFAWLDRGACAKYDFARLGPSESGILTISPTLICGPIVRAGS